MQAAIIVVDEIYGFLPGGALECAHSEEAVAATVAFIRKHPALPVLFVCDHHPADHCSFVKQGGPWPPHCVAGTREAQIHDGLLPFVQEELVFLKGCSPEKEQYSGFEGLNEAGQSLDEVLRLLGCEKLYVTGIATEYCVKNTAYDLLDAGYKVCIVEECLGWVDAEGHKAAISEFKDKGLL